jgi:cysteine desulfurase
MLTPRTVLVTFAYVNSEIGTVQDVKRITRTVRAFNAEHKTNVLVHLDAAQAPLWLSCEMDMLGVHMMTLDAGKCFGPKGVGVLALRHGVTIAPLLLGGGQERGLRSGTENVPLIVGCAEALVRAQDDWKSRSAATAALRDFMFDLIQKEIPGARVNGSCESRVANNVHISIPGIDAEFAVITLDHHGVNASTKSACGAHTGGSSVVRTLTGDDTRATSTLRFTLGPLTMKSEIIEAVQVLKVHVEKTRDFLSKQHTA